MKRETLNAFFTARIDSTSRYACAVILLLRTFEPKSHHPSNRERRTILQMTVYSVFEGRAVRFVASVIRFFEKYSLLSGKTLHISKIFAYTKHLLQKMAPLGPPLSIVQKVGNYILTILSLVPRPHPHGEEKGARDSNRYSRLCACAVEFSLYHQVSL